MGAFLLSAGTKGRGFNVFSLIFKNPTKVFSFSKIIMFLLITEGKTYSLPNSRIMIHQPLGGAQGGQTDIDIQVISSFVDSLCLLFLILGLNISS